MLYKKKKNQEHQTPKVILKQRKISLSLYKISLGGKCGFSKTVFCTYLTQMLPGVSQWGWVPKLG